jgi:hypothetical protein
LVYLLFFAHLLFPWVNFKDKAQKSIGSLGIRWVVTMTYAGFAILSMIYMHLAKISFQSQFLLQAIFVFFLLIGLYGSLASSDKVGQVHQEQANNRALLDDMRKLARLVRVQMESNDNLDNEIKKSFYDLEENMRFISPSNQKEAWDLEIELTSQLQLIKTQINSMEPNATQLASSINSCQQLFKLRKQILSN